MAKGKQTSQKRSQAQALTQDIMYQEIERGMRLISTEDSDQLIKQGKETPPNEYVILMAALRSQMGLAFAVLNKLGLPNITATQKRFSQHQLVCAQLIHNAYALGVKQGQECSKDCNCGKAE